MLQSEYFLSRKKKSLWFAWILFPMISVSLASHADVYYVDQNNPKASDSNPGTEKLPWKTPYAWINNVMAGDTVLVKAGTYNVTQGGSWNIPALNPKNEGKSGSPITFKAYSGHKVVLEGNNKSATIGSNNRDYIVIDGFTVRKGHIIAFGSPSSRLKGIVIQNNTVREKFCGADSNDNCEGIRLQNVSGAVVRNNLIFNVYNRPRTDNSAGFKLYHTNNTIIENNEIYDTIVGIFDKVNGNSNIVRYNYVHDTKRGIGIWSNNGQTIRSNKVYGNIIVSSRMQGIYVAGSSSSPNVGTQVYNNTVVNAGSTAYAIDADVKDARVWNNIAYNAPKSDLNSTNPSFTYCDYNLYYRTTEGCAAESLHTDPKFISTSFRKPEDFKLQASSHAKGAGKDSKDIGAYPTGKEVVGLIRTK